MSRIVWLRRGRNLASGAAHGDALLLEDSFYLLLEDDGRILLE